MTALADLRAHHLNPEGDPGDAALALVATALEGYLVTDGEAARHAIAIVNDGNPGRAKDAFEEVLVWLHTEIEQARAKLGEGPWVAIEGLADFGLDAERIADLKAGRPVTLASNPG